MELQIYKSLWGHQSGIEDAIKQCHEFGWAGLEGPPPATAVERRKLRTQLNDAGLLFIAEVCTAGSYVPDRRAKPSQHLHSLQQRAEEALDCAPQFLTIIAGCDAWDLGVQLEFFMEALRREREFRVPFSFETHRSRSLFNPWITREIITRLPQLKLTCDFSHWCVVCERLIDTEPDVLALCAEHAFHVHARVGYAQGPQVPHPAAPENSEALQAHERWWTMIWNEQRQQGRALSTLTPEFGPDGYLHTLPFTNAPIADLGEINRWMAERQRQRFIELFHHSPR